MNWDKIGGLVSKSAPIIGGLLGGPAGAAVGSLVASALGTTDQEEIEHIIRTDPTALVKIKKLEMAHKAELEKLALEQTKAFLADKQHARETHKDSVFPALLTAFIMLLVATITIGLSHKGIPAENRDVLNMLVGNITGFASAAVAYWIGAEPRAKNIKR